MFEWQPYVSAAERRQLAERHAQALRQKGHTLAPVEARRGAIARTFWGKSWCTHLASYSDYATRLPRGRTYCRNGSVIDLKITPGSVSAWVVGSSLYRVTMTVAAVATPQWQAIGKDCAGTIDSLVELLQGRLSTAVMERLCRRETGLFPGPKEITFRCDCPDAASMCKHVAAILYGIGARLDTQPELLFSLRSVEAAELLAGADAALPLASAKAPRNAKRLDTAKLADVFGLELATEAPVERPAAKKKKRPATKR